MRQAIRLFAGVIMGLIVAGLSIFFIQSIGHEWFEVYRDVPDGKEEFGKFVMDLPIKAILLLLVAHCIGTLLGTITASVISGYRRYIPAIAIGVLMLSGGIINVTSISHPTWFSILDIALYIPAAMAGHKIYLMIVTDPLNVEELIS
jgi:hypothetical protein